MFMWYNALTSTMFGVTRRPDIYFILCKLVSWSLAKWPSAATAVFQGSSISTARSLPHGGSADAASPLRGALMNLCESLCEGLCESLCESLWWQRVGQTKLR